MRYKLPIKFKDDWCFWYEYLQENSSIVKTKVNFLGFTDVADYAQNTDNYDIEVEDNHNYIVNGVVVHNSNASFCLSEDGTKILCFSRNKQLDEHDGLRGFYQWVQKNVKKERLMKNYIYFGEWLVQHKIDYGENANQFYLFDVFNKDTNEFVSETRVCLEGDSLKIKTAPVLADGIVGKDFTLEEIVKMAGKSKLAVNGKGEGIVIKNYSHKNKHGSQVFTKVVTKEFQESNSVKAKVTKTSDAITDFIQQFLTEARVEKMLNKLVDEGKLCENYDITDMGLILKSLGSSVADDIIKEESDVLFKVLKQRIGKSVPSVVRNILEKNDRM